MKSEYDNWGRTARSVADPQGLNRITEVRYDSLDRRSMVVKRWGSNPPPLPTLEGGDRAVELVYDSVGRIEHRRVLKAAGSWMETTTTYNGDGQPLAVTDPNFETTNYDYDGYGRLKTVSLPASGASQLRQTTHYVERNRRGQPLEIEFLEDLPGEDPAQRLVREIVYDPWGRPTAISSRFENPTGEPDIAEFEGDINRTLVYDSLGRVVKAQEASDAHAVPLEVLIGYDTAGRAIHENQRVPVNGTSVDHILTSVFDLDGFREQLSMPEVFTSGGQSLGTYNVIFESDPVMGSLRSVKAPEDPSDLASSLTTLIDVELSGSSIWRQTFGNQVTLKLYNEDDPQNPEPLFDGLGRPTGLRTELPNGQHVSDERYGYDPVGNLAFEQRRHQPDQSGMYRTRAYEHDLLGRTTTVAHGLLADGDLNAFPISSTDPVAALTGVDSSESWDLDDNGNWESWTVADGASETTLEYQVNSLNQYELSSEVDPTTGGLVNPKGRTFDWLGQLREDGRTGHVFIWDTFGRLAEVRSSVGSTIAKYRYDSLGRRVERTVTPSSYAGIQDATTLYFYDGLSVVEERALVGPGGSQTEVVRARYGYVGGMDAVAWMDRDVAQSPDTGQNDFDGDNGVPDPYSGSPNGVVETRLYLHRDFRGSIVAATSDSTSPTVEERYEYSMYGKQTVWEGTTWPYSVSHAVSRFGIPYGFTGQRVDVETGLTYMKNRYYDPSDGRFISRDPLGYVDGPNLYQYASSSPAMRTDPLGLLSNTGPDFSVGMGKSKPGVAAQQNGVNVGGPAGPGSTKKGGGAASVAWQNFMKEIAKAGGTRLANRVAAAQAAAGAEQGIMAQRRHYAAQRMAMFRAFVERSKKEISRRAIAKFTDIAPFRPLGQGCGDPPGVVRPKDDPEHNPDLPTEPDPYYVDPLISIVPSLWSELISDPILLGSGVNHVKDPSIKGSGPKENKSKLGPLQGYNYAVVGVNVRYTFEEGANMSEYTVHQVGVTIQQKPGAARYKPNDSDGPESANVQIDGQFITVFDAPGPIANNRAGEKLADFTRRSPQFWSTVNVRSSYPAQVA